MTASRVLGGHGYAGEETRARVLAAAQALGYRPNVSARALRTQQTRLLGVYAAHLSRPLHHELLLGARTEAARYGYRLVLEAGAEGERAGAALACDGYLVVPGASGLAPAAPPQAVQAGIPTIYALSRPASWHGDAVVTDFRRATGAAVSHLASRGYRRVGLLSYDPPAHRGAPPTDVTAGYLEAVRDAGMDTDKALIAQLADDDADVEQVLGRLLDLAEPPDCLVVLSVAATPTALRYLSRRGVRPAGPLGFVGTEGTRNAWSDLLSPSLTVLRVPGYEIGRLSTRRLVHTLTGSAVAEGAPALVTEVPCDLVEGDSSRGRASPTRVRGATN